MKRLSKFLIGIFLVSGSFTVNASVDPMPLERFELKDLRVKDVELTGCKPVAYIFDPNGYLHTVSAGEGIGKHGGRIVLITESKVVIVELWPDSSGGWTEISKDIPVPNKY